MSQAANDPDFDADTDENGQDTFDRFRDVAVEQMASLAQLAAEARRLGLIPELPRELLEKLDLGGMLLDLVRLQLKHATAVANVIGPQARNLEKLNHLSALLAKGKSGAPRVVHGVEHEHAELTWFELYVDNPTDRPQNVAVSLGSLHQLDVEDDDYGRAFAEKPVSQAELMEAFALAESDETGPLPWSLLPKIATVAAREVRSFRLLIPGLPREYETTAVVRMSPLGSYQRFQLRPPQRKKGGASHAEET
jgi:hypothetical protein